MSKTKSVVIDDQNEAAASEQQVNNRRRDMNRLTKETNYQLFSALTQAMKEVQGDRYDVTADQLQTEVLADICEYLDKH